MIFIDLEIFYDKVLREVLWWILTKNPIKYIDIITYMYDGVMVNDKTCCVTPSTTFLTYHILYWSFHPRAWMLIMARYRAYWHHLVFIVLNLRQYTGMSVSRIKQYGKAIFRFSLWTDTGQYINHVAIYRPVNKIKKIY